MIKKPLTVVALVCATTVSLTAQTTYIYPTWWDSDNHFVEVEANTESNMTMTVMGTIDGVRCDSAFEIGVYCSDGECREVHPFFRYEYQTYFERFGYYSKLTINGNTGESYSFRLYDHRNGVEVLADVVPAGIEFVADKDFGGLSNLYELAFNSSTTHCSALTIDDAIDLPFTGHRYCITADGIACSYTRNAYLDGGYETIILPFDADVADIREAGFVFEKFVGLDGNTISFVELAEDESLQAGVPYLFRYSGSPSEERVEVVFSAMVSRVSDSVVVSEGWTGTFVRMDGSEIAGKYILNPAGDKMQKAGAGASLAPYHCYLELPAGVDVATLAVSHRDGSAIDDVVSHARSEEIVDLWGRRLDEMPERGFVIKNNVKIYIKGH